MKIAILAVLILCVLVAVACKAGQPKFVPFYPTYEDDKDEYYTQKEYSVEMRKNLLQVLDYYEVKYKLDKETILILEKEYQNKELMCNYTQKSMDQNWLKEHKK